MKKLNYLLFALILGLTVSITSCSDDDNDPIGPDVVEGISNKTINELKALAKKDEIVEIKEDVIIEGVVVSNDTEGNFYKEIWLQETKTDAKGGIKFKINEKALNTKFVVGQKMSIKCKGLDLEIYGGQVTLGSRYADSETGDIKLGGMDPLKISTNIVLGKVITLEATAVKISDISDDMIGNLIKIEAVQVVSGELTNTYAKDKKATNITIEDKDANTVILRSSGYAKFAGETVAQKNGSLIAIVSKYNDTYQLAIRDLKDIDFTAERFDGIKPTDKPDEKPVEGDTGINAGDDTVSGASDLFISEYVEGASSNKYLEIYNGTGAEVDLSNYTVKLATNGKKFTDEKIGVFALSGKLPNGAVLVIANKQAALTLNEGVTVNTSLSEATYFNGDDSIGLFKGETLIDLFGVEGIDPGSAWEVNGVAGATKDHTLVRNASVVAPNATFTEAEWTVKEKEDISNIGAHTMN